MRKILITGGCGFIGSHLVEFFLKKKLKVIVFDKKGKRYEKNWLKNLKQNVSLRERKSGKQEAFMS